MQTPRQMIDIVQPIIVMILIICACGGGSELWQRNPRSWSNPLVATASTYHQHCKISQVIAFTDKFPCLHVCHF